ncbi:glycosyltransferase family 2 protein [Flavobacterium sp. FlaQc-52]|jgi:glycosyltransferase involved in cell wall biosynthesis|uniref:glycosyltransferase family 2 protein n=1 Tax=Flavobacterium sp. FlaQc-52 TaxID=3374185 RepID=UPI00375806B8
MSFFSIIIPLYNKEDFIENTIQSVLDQNFQGFEIIIVNDGSTDKSEEKVFQFNDSRIHYFSKKNEGVSIARNFGIDKAKANFITFLDADDYWYPDFLAVMHQGINDFPNQKIFSGAIEIETSRKRFPAQYSVTITNDFQLVNYFKASQKESIIWTSCAVFHKSIFEETGNFDPQIKSNQDTDLWIRIGLVYPILFSGKILARYIYDKNSLSRNNNLLNAKMNLLKFIEIEKTNQDLKNILDLNRFSLAIKSKLNSDKILFNYYYRGIDLKKIGIKKRFLLLLPPYLLRFLIQLKLTLANLGLGSSVFK